MLDWRHLRYAHIFYPIVLRVKDDAEKSKVVDLNILDAEDCDVLNSGSREKEDSEG